MDSSTVLYRHRNLRNRTPSATLVFLKKSAWVQVRARAWVPTPLDNYSDFLLTGNLQLIAFRL